MRKLKRISTVAGLLVCLSFCFALLSWGATSGTVNIVAGWNLLGNSSSGVLDVATTFGNSTQVTTVWKWVPSKSNWAFYTPLQTDGGAAYAASKGYDLLTSINGGDGFWVNAKTSFTAPLPAGTSVTSASYQTTLVSGWNLLASGDNNTPSQFNQALSTAPPPFGTIPINLITLWSWDALLANWYFYAPSLEASGGTALSDYVTGKGYLNFGTKTIDPATGFWVNRSAPPASIALSSAGVPSALPMSILTLTGTGFDTTATTIVRFFDANQYSVDVRPVRVSSTSIAVSVPPYFNSTSAIFAPGTVSVKVIQTSGSGTRTSAALAGFQILDLPTAAGPAGAVTLNLLQSLQTQATTLQTSITGTALDSTALRSSLASQASSLAPLITAVQSVVQNASQRVSLGTLNGVSVNMGASELQQTDRLLLGMFLALGSGTSALASASGTAIARLVDQPLGPGASKSNLSRAARIGAPVQLASNGALDQLAISILANGLLDGSHKGASIDALRNEVIQLAQTSSSGGCLQQESSTYTQCVKDLGASSCTTLPTLAGQESVPCRSAGAGNTALTIVGAGLVAAVAIAALAGTPVAATVGVLALTGYLAYATIATGLVEIGIGATLGQTSAGAQQLVEGGLKQLNDFARDTAISSGVGAAAGATAGLINDAVTAAKNLGDALEQTVFPATATTTTPTTTTTTTSTTATTIGASACLANLIACEQPASCGLACINACERVYFVCQ
jgi:hypothetical protein